MQQWQTCKDLAKDAVLLFRLGDFYEAFYEDAKLLSKELELTLTQRQGVPMSGVPYHAHEAYVDKLIKRGYKVAIAEQMEAPQKGKSLVRREITRTISPATVLDSSKIEEKEPNFFVCLEQIGSIYGIAFLDLSTNSFHVTEMESLHALETELYRIRAKEILCSEKFTKKHSKLFEDLKLEIPFLSNIKPDWFFDHQSNCSFLLRHFAVHSLDGFGLKTMTAAVNAAGALLQYIKNERQLNIAYIRRVEPSFQQEYLNLDRITQKNLELCESLHPGKSASFFEFIDKTQTAMGARLLRKWLLQALRCKNKILQRQNVVKELLRLGSLVKLNESLAQIRDIERLMSKISASYASPKDLQSLGLSLKALPSIREFLKNCPSELVEQALEKIKHGDETQLLIERSLVEELPPRLGDGPVFKKGLSEELDQLRALSSDSKSYLAQYQQKLREETQIKTLKVSYNRVFGYYIEVSRNQSQNIPTTFEKRQTLSNSERYISKELKDFEEKILSAEEKIKEIENKLFKDLIQKIIQGAEEIRSIASGIAFIDCASSLTKLAHENKYVCPKIMDSYELEIKDGRHPLVEQNCPQFITNDLSLEEKERLMILTGPNMAGKSTYIRQIALIVIMAQMGSFVPAREAKIGIVDKIFTRIGASDDLARGQSTFMVEMAETANILNNASKNSLVILDEIGRGTSTFDGISIAWSVAEHLLKKIQAKTLFATHYWELTKMPARLEGVVNYHIKVQEEPNNVVFLHKIEQGSSKKSYGIHVGRLAGLPPAVLHRAEEILKKLEEQGRNKKVEKTSKNKQLLLFEPQAKKPVGQIEDELANINTDELSPIQALLTLKELKTRHL